jgi:hypothetical protein
MVEQIIIDTALGYRFDDNSRPRMSEDIKASVEDTIAQWNLFADQIDKWAAQKPKFADGFIGLRLGWSGALGCQFRLTEGAIRAGAQRGTAHWRAIGVLDDLAQDVARHPTKFDGASRFAAMDGRLHLSVDDSSQAV